jgi:hypothetical protein
VELWQAAGVAPRGAWYVKSERGAAGNAATTRDADARGAYVLMDRATYLTLKKEIGLQLLVERDPALLNYIAVIRVNPARLPKVNAAGARAFQDWLVSEEAQQIIKGFEVDRYGEPLFFSNIGTSTSSRPESWVLVVVERMTTPDWASAVPVEVARRAAVASQSPAINRAIMTRLHGACAGRRSWAVRVVSSGSGYHYAIGSIHARSNTVKAGSKLAGPR